MFSRRRVAKTVRKPSTPVTCQNLMPETSLHKAARDGNRHEIEALVNEGLNVNETGAQGTSRLQPTRRCWRRNASARVMRDSV